MNIKRYRIVWEIFKFLHRNYKPPFGSIGHAIQSGKITHEEALDYLEKTNYPKYKSLMETENDRVL